MRRLGLIGGTSWHSTAIYYRLINEGVNQRLGGLHSAELLLASLDFETVFRNSIPENGVLIVETARGLVRAGVEGIVLCANTMHRYAEEVEEATGLPVIHIADASAKACLSQGASTVALLGTRWTMEEDFFRQRLEAFGLRWLIPDEPEREFIHQSVFEEMGLGIFCDDTRAQYLGIIDELRRQGAEAAILGCTEIPLLIRPGDTDLPTVDTTEVHAQAALDFMFS